MQKEIIFVVDPMCSWCWGFSPVIEALLKTQLQDYQFSLVVGGLCTKGEMPWDETSKNYLKGHWQQVSQTTGQTFSDGLFKKEQFEYDTYPSCKAVVTVRELFGMKSAFTYLHRIQEAFYTEAQDMTSEEVLTDIVKAMGLDSELFKRFFESDRAQLLMEHDFAKARSMGATAFPSVVIIDEDGHMVSQKGYRSLQEMQKLLK